MPKLAGHSPNQRKTSILDLLRQDGEVRVAELAERFRISSVTIRSDLAEMEEEGLLRRTHGGAVSAKKAYYDMSLNDRMKVNREEKIRIAKACAGMIDDGDTLMVDSGTTTLCLAKELAGRSNLTIVTNALQIAEELACGNSAKVILLGGDLDPLYQFTYGADAVEQLQKYRADKMVLAVDGISRKHGLSTYHHQEADVSRQMIERSNTVIAVADHSKIGKEGFSHIAPLTSIDILVTDHYGANRQELDGFRQAGVAVEEAPL